ncbi:RNA/RNP complex-1-interacting phosphatase [Syngnathus typhle]|uniref:RNA/RNP complex-1-interacting phosphatase n=1 Tax=Syngnathus typhle TaxID=161592 RepID=UPI002A6B5D8C|nr:RNA/RNP complex-1-interacting phosphatase [Syngnathus typhle]
MRSFQKIPDRWLDYKAVGKRLGTTRFVAFKVPLKQALTQNMAPAQAFGPKELLDVMREDQQELGLIIDLTYTTRYYSPQELPNSLSFIKIPTAGHVVPADSVVVTFKRAVRQFLRDNACNDKLIGVHCTHGLNRTGYMICRYLIEVDKMAPTEAIRLFNSSRGHNIERQNYIEDLQSRPKSNTITGMASRPPPSVRGRAGHWTPAAPGDAHWSGAGHNHGFCPPRAQRQQPYRGRPQCDSPQHYGPPRSGGPNAVPPAHAAGKSNGRGWPRSATRRGWHASTSGRPLAAQPRYNSSSCWTGTFGL